MKLKIIETMLSCFNSIDSIQKTENPQNPLKDKINFFYGDVFFRSNSKQKQQQQNGTTYQQQNCVILLAALSQERNYYHTNAFSKFRS